MEHLSLTPSSTPTPPSSSPFLAGVGHHQALPVLYLMASPRYFGPSSSVGSPFPDDKTHQVVWLNLKKIPWVDSRQTDRQKDRQTEIRLSKFTKYLALIPAHPTASLPPAQTAPHPPWLKKALCPTLEPLIRRVPSSASPLFMPALLLPLSLCH